MDSDLQPAIGDPPVVSSPTVRPAPSVQRRALALLREVGSTVLLVLIVFGASRLLVQTVQVRGTSMLPTLQDNQYMLLDTLSYRLHEPRRGDIIVFLPLVDHEDYVKRVIGVPGDRVGVKSGTVYLNGVALKEPYIRMPHTYSFDTVRVPKGNLFVLGDNRDASYDSHMWTNAQGQPMPFVPESRVVGRAMLTVWPLNQLQVLTTPAMATNSDKK